jgi:hypothetical protein
MPVPDPSPQPAEPDLAGLRTDLHRARSALIEAELAERASDRYLAAHLAALRVAAVVLACRARPGNTRRGPRNAWLLLARVAPEFSEWAAFFAATEGKRDAVRAGATAIVSARDADDLVRDAGTFLGLVEHRIGSGATAINTPGSAAR